MIFGHEQYIFGLPDLSGNEIFPGQGLLEFCFIGLGITDNSQFKAVVKEIVNGFFVVGFQVIDLNFGGTGDFIDKSGKGVGDIGGSRNRNVKRYR